MVTVRKANSGDSAAILALLQEHDMAGNGRSDEHFWVAEESSDLIGVVQVEPVPDAVFLSYLLVSERCRGRGIARKLVTEALKNVDVPTYLYTIIPSFFKQLGFVATLAPEGLPPREIFGCDTCEPGKCVCMVREHG